MNAAELRALDGLMPLAIVVYLRLWEQRNPTSGLVRGYTWAALAQACYVEPHRGVAGGSPHISALRRALAWLERRRLIVSRSTKPRPGKVGQLILYVRLASRESCVQKKADSKPDSLNGHAVIGKMQRSAAKADTKADCTVNPVVVVRKATSKSTPPLIFPKQLSEAEAEWIKHDLKAAKLSAKRAQLVLDELAGAIATRRVRENRRGWARTVIEAAKNRNCQFDFAHNVAAERARLATLAQSLTENRSRSAEPISLNGRAHLAEAMALVKSRRAH